MTPIEYVWDALGSRVADHQPPSKETGAPTAQLVTNQFLAAFRKKQISPKTVARRMRGGGLYACRPFVFVSDDQTAPYCPLQWCRIPQLDWIKD
ncbi:hypothetical protein TNCV_1719801 [Trichonephila clavipes]|nr:hypothetical protein TNCV_1719801 [Trichonephila clavipes]